MALSQHHRMIRIATPLGEDVFIVLSFSGVEGISRDVNFALTLASEKNDITFDQLAGKNVTVSIASSDGKERFFNGIIVEFMPMETSVNGGISKYHAVMVPTLWVLNKCVDCRIFQDTSVPDIIKQVLAALPGKGVSQTIDYRMELTGTYALKAYCVQYNETDLNFINRLCEYEGIFYFFEHENKKHTLVFADKADKHKPFMAGNTPKVIFQSPQGGHLEKEVITALHPINRLMTGKYMARDYNFIMPNNDMTVKNTTVVAKPTCEGEIYEYPGGYAVTEGEGNALAHIRMQANDAQTIMLHGQSTIRGFVPGCKFSLSEHPLEDMNGKEYVLTQVRHEAKQDISTGAPDGDVYYNLFSCIPYSSQFRPQCRHRRPTIPGSQTAIVTGPKDEEIHTDEHGRIKVKFHWDRRGDQNNYGNMSCWIRVSQSWAGARWGAIHIPRVGQEVIVNFLDGDPDRPIVTGCVYHGLNKPPYALPAEKTKSTIKSNSTNGGDGNANEICFEDLKDAEEFYTHAAKDRNEVVENDMRTEVKRNQSIMVEKNRSVTIASGNETVAVQNGTRTVSVTSNETHANTANYNHKVSGNYTLKVNGNITIDASGLVTISGAKIILNG